MDELILETNVKERLFNLTFTESQFYDQQQDKTDLEVGPENHEKVLTLFLDGNEDDPSIMCHTISEMFTMNPKTQKQHEALWQQIDEYYKRKLQADLEHETLTKSERKSKEFNREFTAEEKEAGFTSSLEGLSNDQIQLLHEIDY